MKEIAEFIGELDDAEGFTENERAAIQNIDGDSLPLNCIVPMFISLVDRFALE
jgi:hypothetical protein